MSSNARLNCWREIPYVSGISCDVCWSEELVKLGSVPVRWFGRPDIDTGLVRVWHLCDNCFLSGTGNLSRVAVDGDLVYLQVIWLGSRTEHRFVHVPLMSRDQLM